MSRILLFFCFLFVFVFAQDAFARPPECGKIDRQSVAKVYEGARDIDYHYNIVSDIKNICDDMQRFLEWERLRKNSLSGKEYTKKRRDLLDNVGGTFYRLESPLMIMSLWYRTDPKDHVEKTIRTQKIKNSKIEVESCLEALKKARGEVAELMVYYDR